MLRTVYILAGRLVEWQAPPNTVGELDRRSRVRLTTFPRARPLIVAVLVALMPLGYGAASAKLGDGALLAQHRYYREMALRTQQHTWRVLAHPGGAAECEGAPYVTYRRDTQNVAVSDHWYVALQVRADAALIRLGEERFLCQVDKAIVWMDRLWDPVQGGYAPRADLDGRNPTVSDIYADDNAVIGLAFLEAARVLPDPTARAQALSSAEYAADYLIRSGLWDATFGGGLWWNTQREATVEGKPAQTTALLAQLMAELYAETGRPHYREWALAAQGWLDGVLFDPVTGLYFYGVNWSPDDPNVPLIAERYFGYDQAIVIQTLLQLHRQDSGAGHLGRAQDLGRRLDHAFWHQGRGGYTLDAHGADIYAPYAAWISEALLDLYVADGDRFWRDRSRANLDALHRTFLDRATGGYAMRSFPCEGDFKMWCFPNERWGFDRVTYTMTQALMQRAAALQAAAH